MVIVLQPNLSHCNLPIHIPGQEEGTSFVVLSTGSNAWNQPLRDTEMMRVFNNGTVAKCIHPANMNAPKALTEAAGGLLFAGLTPVPLICGGRLAKDESYNRRCYGLGQGIPSRIGTLSRERVGAASLVINNGSTLWMTGGSNVYGDDQDTTDLLTIDIDIDIDGSDNLYLKTANGPKLPRRISYHCLERVGTTAILFGGSDTIHPTPIMGQVWTWDLSMESGSEHDGFWQERASMLHARRKHICGVLRSEEGRQLIIAAGGELDDSAITDTVDLLIVKGEALNKGWQPGPTLPMPLRSAVSVTTASGDQMLVSGGITNKQEYSVTVLRLQCQTDQSCQWRELEIKLHYGRASMVGIVLSGAIHEDNDTLSDLCSSFAGDGECDGSNNIDECFFDGGDCCLETSLCQWCDGEACNCHSTGVDYCENKTEPQIIHPGKSLTNFKPNVY